MTNEREPAQGLGSMARIRTDQSTTLPKGPTRLEKAGRALKGGAGWTAGMLAKNMRRIVLAGAVLGAGAGSVSLYNALDDGIPAQQKLDAYDAARKAYQRAQYVNADPEGDVYSAFWTMRNNEVYLVKDGDVFDMGVNVYARDIVRLYLSYGPYEGMHITIDPNAGKRGVISVYRSQERIEISIYGKEFHQIRDLPAERQIKADYDLAAYANIDITPKLETSWSARVTNRIGGQDNVEMLKIDGKISEMNFHVTVMGRSEYWINLESGYFRLESPYLQRGKTVDAAGEKLAVAGKISGMLAQVQQKRFEGPKVTP